MAEVMLQGTIECGCGNIYYFQSMRPEIICMKCEKMHPNNGEPVPEEQPIEEGDPDGIND